MKNPYILLTIADTLGDGTLRKKRVNTDHIEDYGEQGQSTMITMTSGRSFRCSESVYDVDYKIAALYPKEP